MNIPNNRTQLLQQIPVFALRELVGEHIEEPAVRERFRSVLHRKPRDFQRALCRLTREHLTRLIDASPEVTNDEINAQFEEHRYGISPSFYIYVFDPARLDRAARTGFREKFEQNLEEFNAAREMSQANVRRVALNDLGPLRDRLEVIEATYRFQSRLDYIDEYEQAVSPYETLYGFFWLNTADGYVIIQARQPDVLKAVRDAIKAAANIDLTALVITKRFKNSLGFLDAQQMRSVRLHDPIPDSPSFRWLSISDDHLYEKDYQSWEERYPEVRSARYHAVLEEVKDTMLTIRCDQGAISLAGAIRASLFRNWCLNTLGEIIRIHNTFAKEAAAFVPTLDLTGKAELLRFTAPQKERILDLIVALLTVKGGAGADLWPLNGSALELAAVLGKYVRVQAPYQCQEPGCGPDEELLVECPICGRKFFLLQYNNSGWELICQEERGHRWIGRLPLKFEDTNGHPIKITEEGLADMINIIPLRGLIQTTADMINGYLKGHSFDPVKETFYIRGCNLWYFPDRGKALAHILVIQNIGTVEAGGKVTGVEMGMRLDLFDDKGDRG